MAILYGTTADGDSLPVEVNEFGQLVAQGLQGQEGPPGPPGLPELPPDPFEGAILGWKDNTLSWLGGSVPIPEGTYGPIAAYQGGLLTLANAIDLPYLTEIELSDSAGAPVFFSYSTSPITNVSTSDSRQYLKQIQNCEKSQAVMGKDNANNERSFSKNALFAQYPDQDQVVRGDELFPGVYGEAYSWMGSVPNELFNIRYQFTAETTATITGWKRHFEYPYGMVSGCKTDSGLGPSSTIVRMPIIGEVSHVLTLADNFNFEQFSVGDLVQAPNAVITNIDAGNNKITVVNGDWVGTNGSGTPSGENRVYTPDKTGKGTVQSCQGNSIVLREDNKNWIVGDYITVPGQAMAARYVYADQLRKKLK